MKAEDQKECRRVVSALRDCLATGVLTAPEFHRALVSVAYEYAIAEEVDTAVSLLVGIPLTYFQLEQAQQMLDDPTYAAICQVIARHLSLAGYLENFAFTSSKVLT
jgi:hypothetical protein